MISMFIFLLKRGIITEELTGAYVPFKYVERLKNAEPFDSAHHRQPSWLIIACDPNSGGSSDTAIVALTVVKGLIVVWNYYCLLILSLSSLLC